MRVRVDGGRAAPQLTVKRPAQSPEVTATAGAVWRPIAALSLSSDIRLESTRFEDDINTRRLNAGALVGLEARWRLAEMLAQNGDPNGARQALTALVATGIQDSFVDQARKRLGGK